MNLKKKLSNTAPLSDRVSNWTKTKIRESAGVKRDQNMPYIPNQKIKTIKDKPLKKVPYGALAQSYEPQGEMIERKMTSAENDKKEKYVKGMKKDKGGFTKRYGKDGKSVMYATATKMAMKKEETLVEKPGDGYLGPAKVGIPNPIRLAKDAVDQMNRANQRKVNTVNKISPGSATMPNFKQFNPTTSAAYKNLFQSHEPEGEMIEAKVDQGKSQPDKINTRNQRTFGNRRGNKSAFGDDMRTRRYNTKAGRGVKTRGEKDKRPMNYQKRDSDATLKSLFKDKGISTKSFDKTKREKDKLPYRTEDFYRKKYDVKDGGYKKTNKMTKSNKRAGDSKAQNRELHIDLKKYKLKKLKTEGSLHKWFSGSKSKDGKGGWVNVVTGGTCASDKPGEGTPKCVSSSKRASMSKAERLSASRRKKKADPGQQSKSGAAKPTYVSTDKKKSMKEGITFAQFQEACWKGYEKKGMKTMFGKRYPNCVKKTKKEEVELEAFSGNPAQQAAIAVAKKNRKQDLKIAKKKKEMKEESCGKGMYYCTDDKKCKPIPKGYKEGKDGMLVKEDMKGMSQKSGDKRSTKSGAGMTAKGVAKYNRRTGGNLKTAVTTPPSKLKAGSKAAKRRKSFCARSKSWTGPRGKAARRRWNC